jgi:hypothetical protein
MSLTAAQFAVVVDVSHLRALPDDVDDIFARQRAEHGVHLELGFGAVAESVDLEGSASRR